MIAVPVRTGPRPFWFARESRSWLGGSWNEGTWNSYANGSSSIAAIIASWNGGLFTDEVIARLNPLPSSAGAGLALDQ
jgi:hypothetical protein